MTTPWWTPAETEPVRPGGSRSSAPKSRAASGPWIAVGVGTVIAVVLVAGVGAWAVATFFGQITTPPATCVSACQGIAQTQVLPTGKSVSVQWVDHSGGAVSFGVKGPGGIDVPQCQWAEAASGVCSFQSVGGNYSFFAENYPGSVGGQVVDYRGDYPTPLL